MLVSMYLNRVSKKVVYGSIENLKEQVFNDIISKIDFNKYKDKPVIIRDVLIKNSGKCLYTTI